MGKKMERAIGICSLQLFNNHKRDKRPKSFMEEYL
jgi:hypothetical protein